MMKRLTVSVVLSLLACAVVSQSHDVITTNLTYTRDISRVFSARCLGCHGASSSIPLTTYEQVRPWAVSIKEQVLSRTMPPWGAVKGFGELQVEGALAQEEIMLIAAWVIGGAPQGNPALLPKPLESARKAEPPVLLDAAQADTRIRLDREVQLAGLRPLTQARIGSARVTATLPDGKVIPLVWLYQYDPAFHRTFTFRHSIALPPGTIVASNQPLRFVLEAQAVKAPVPGS